MADTIQVLGQVNSTTLGAATAGTLCTASTNGTTVSSITVCNTNSTACTFTIWIRSQFGSGTSTDSITTQALYYNVALSGNTTYIATIGLTLGNSATENIRVQSNVTGVVFMAFGVNT